MKQRVAVFETRASVFPGERGFIEHEPLLSSIFQHFGLGKTLPLEFGDEPDSVPVEEDRRVYEP